MATTSTPGFIAQRLLEFVTREHDRREEPGDMPTKLKHYTRSQAHQSAQRPESNSHSPDLAFLDQPRYYKTDGSLSQITASTSRNRRDESEPVSSMSQSENALEDGQHSLLEFFRSYSLHIVVAVIIYLFLFEITVRVPFLLALAFAVPSIHMLLTPTKPKLHNATYEYESEKALYRRSSIIPSIPGEPAVLYKTKGTIPGLTFFSPSTWFPRTTDPVDFRHKRLRLHTTFRESAYQPRRTFREAWEDTGPRVLESWGMFALETLCFQIASRVIMRVAQFAYEAMVGGEVNDNFVHIYVMSILRFYRDWTVGVGGLIWHVMKRLVGKVLLLLGKQVMMVGGGMWETRLEYEDAKTLQL